MGRLLLIEDEEGLADMMMRGLREAGYHVDHSGNGQQGLTMALADPYDVIILDWRLPGIDGLTILECLRGAKSTTPILMLTALRDVDYRIKGLDAGADDYLTKPFSFEELLARLRALTRRSQAEKVPTGHDKVLLSVGSLEMDTIRHTAHLNGKPLTLRMKEFKLLELLMRRSGEVVSRTTIAEIVWGSPFDVRDNSVDSTVSYLRKNLETSFADHPKDINIETIRGLGYRLSIVGEQ